MSESTEEKPYRYFKYEIPEPGEEVVISGISGRFPNSDNVNILKENILNGVDCISEDDRRWALDHPEIPKRHGVINNIEKFDAEFFNIGYKQAHTMDPMGRMLLEHTYEAIVDAGINPKDLRGKRMAVIIGSCFSESEKTWFYEKIKVDGYGILGCSRSMLANRISQWLGVSGVSYTVDTACSSSIYAMEHAYRSIRFGQCDYAIIGGTNLCLHPFVSLQFSRLGVLSADGKCKCFDKDANGYTRSETVAVAFLQKARNAKRIYATLAHAKTNCDGYKEEGITFPSSERQALLLDEFYKECGIPINDIKYIEAHGTGTRVGDPEELNAIDKIFCKNRDSPLRVGSIKGNLGHTEPASGVVSLTKAIITMETGIIPPNIHYVNPREDVECFKENRIKVVSEPTPFEGDYIGINSFGFGGANGHVLLQLHPKNKYKRILPNDNLPRLVTVSGRNEEAVESLLNSINKQPINIEYIRLFHEVHREEIVGHLYRGYTIASRKEVKKDIREIEAYSNVKMPIWFVFSGLGSEWSGVGQALMEFTVFAKAIEKCDAVLKPRKLNIYDILTKSNNKVYDNVLHSSVGIAAIQIGLVDLLTTVGVIPDYIIGHSIGELGCAYADGSLTAEEVILVAYSRGLALIQSKIPSGSMAIVEIGHNNIKKLCPADIDVAAHNGPDSSIISGPTESVKAFIKNLQGKKISVIEVPCNNIPYHSRYVVPAGPKLLSYLKEVIPVNKVKSEKWLSTSVPRNEWSSLTGKLSFAEYYTNSLLKPVLFEETIALIPENAVTIEIGPHAFLSTILNKSLNPTVKNIPLTLKDHKNNIEVFLQGLGKLFNVGQQLDLAKLYPPIEFPVNRGTPMISPFIKWNHSKDWYVTSFKMQERIVSGERTVDIALIDEDFEFIVGHNIDGRNLFPATGYLALVWETMGMIIGELYTEVGDFEVIEGDTAIVTGNIRVPTDISKEKLPDYAKEESDDKDEVLQMKDIYKELRLRGYQYSGLFRNFKSSSLDGCNGHVIWNKNWVAFMDNLLQLKILTIDTRGLFVPTGIQRLVIDAKYHQQLIRNLPDDEQYIPVKYYPKYNMIVGGGIEICNLSASAIPRRKPTGDPVLEEYRFVAHRDNEIMSLRDILTFSVHLSLENVPSIAVKTIEIIDENDKVPVENIASSMILDILENLPMIQANVNIFTAPTIKFTEDDNIPKNINISEIKKLQSDDGVLLAIGYNLLRPENIDKLKQIVKVTKLQSFILTREDSDLPLDLSILKEHQLGLIAEKRNSGQSYILLKKLKHEKLNTIVIEINSNEFSWIEKIKSTVEKELEDGKKNLKVILVEEGNFESGLVGFINCLQREPEGDIYRGVLIQDPKAPKFSLDLPLYSEQLDLNLNVNVLRPGNVWGTYRHFLLPPLKDIYSYHGIIIQMVRGDLSSFHCVEGPFTKDDPDLIKVHYTAINFKDVMIATGKLAAEVMTDKREELDFLIGFEFSGVSKTGERLMGLNANRALSNYVKKSEYTCWKIPDNWSLEEAATVPAVYITCLTAFYLCTNLFKGAKILIHAGSGGIGQAAINLALAQDCEIFVTVGTQEKRSFIRKTFPSIDENHIGCSRDTSFEQMIYRETNGRGVDFVLNSLAEEKLQASIRCLVDGGTFLEIGKFDIVSNNKIDSEIFKKNISFHGVMVDRIMITDNIYVKKIYKLVKKHIDNGSVKPIIRTIFQKDQVEEAIRFMAGGKHIGKILIQMGKKEDPPDMLIKTIPYYTCSSTKSYIIMGGLGGFGLELIDWLIIRGARNIVITSRNGIKNGYQRLRLKMWERYKTNIKILKNLDASKREDCEIIVKTAISLGPVDGIFNLAASLKDSILKNQTIETFEESFMGKAWPTKRLDEISRILCPELRHFVVFSSVSCGRGNAGQTNYGMANSIMERICERRVEEGLPGLAIQWGAIGEVGLVADMMDNDKELIIGGTLQQKITSCLKELDGFLLQNKPIVASMVVAEKRAGGYGIKDLKTVSQQTSLAELGMDSMMAVEIKQTLEREFEILLTAQDIRSLNFAKLIEMDNRETSTTNTENRNVKEMFGIKKIFELFGKKLNKNLIFPLNTNPEEGRKEMYFIPGIEGYGIIFKNLESKIKSPVISLQLASRVDLTTIPDMANSFISYILERLKNQQDFTIVGYSFGSLIAIEIVRILESKGFNGKLIIIDGGPLAMKLMVKQQLYASTLKELENNILLNFSETFDSDTIEKIANKLDGLNTWEEKQNMFISNMPNEYKKLFNEEEISNAITSYYLRLKSVQDYNLEPTQILKSPITLCKPNNMADKVVL
ncbi:hypothetical protein M0802_002413 [Mischocyttarus mexicanus]|nr:hypothetical protein M0802_002413 [Mischocyttarus mexicanus]